MLGSNSQPPFCLSLPSAWIISISHHTWLKFIKGKGAVHSKAAASSIFFCILYLCHSRELSRKLKPKMLLLTIAALQMN